MGEEQFCFIPGRGTTDAVFASRHVIEKQRPGNAEGTVTAHGVYWP